MRYSAAHSDQKRLGKQTPNLSIERMLIVWLPALGQDLSDRVVS